MLNYWSETEFAYAMRPGNHGMVRHKEERNLRDGSETFSKNSLSKSEILIQGPRQSSLFAMDRYYLLYQLHRLQSRIKALTQPHLRSPSRFDVSIVALLQEIYLYTALNHSCSLCGATAPLQCHCTTWIQPSRLSVMYKVL